MHTTISQQNQMQAFQSLLKTHADRVEKALDAALETSPRGQEIDRPARLLSAMRYASLDGGKRLRPFLLMESAALFGISPEQSVHAGIALECIHCYSLVHDDLPAMDDDALRRGRPTTHKAYDEATAILAGDALLTLAFDILASEKTHPDPSVRVQLVALYAQSAGLGGMAGGQMHDLEAETRSNLSEDEITTLQAMKTGTLIACACEGGAILAGADQDEIAHLRSYGKKIGQAFQLADDMLDITSDAATMGKETGKDANKGKGTLVGLYGIEKSRALIEQITADALDSLKSFGPKADVLRDTACFIAERKN